MKCLILSASLLMSLANGAMASDAPAKVIFGADERPVDGDLVEVTFTRDFSDLYAATLHTIPGGLRDPRLPQPTEATEELASGMVCEGQYADEIGTLTGFVCEVDRRKIDAPRVQIFAYLNDRHKYDVRMFVIPSGSERPSENRLLGSDLKLTIVR
ncbi:MAG: hypothetical protein NTV34_05705 [Proteobacteria bacterium]|nr:hypothetical protein [Pseudomonadota bacterium]